MSAKSRRTCCVFSTYYFYKTCAQEQKLDMENTRLRAELHALNKQCQKLRAERDSAKESSYLATERATALEQVPLMLRKCCLNQVYIINWIFLSNVVQTPVLLNCFCFLISTA